MHSRYFKFMFALLASAECRVYHLKYISNRDVTSITRTSLRQHQAFSVVGCMLICINTKGCINTLFNNDMCSLLRRRHQGQSHRVVENEGPVMTHLDVSGKYSYLCHKKVYCQAQAFEIGRFHCFHKLQALKPYTQQL